LIAVTSADIYLRSETWRFAFAVRQDGNAVVSDARLDPRFYRVDPDTQLLLERTEKMVTKEVGILDLGLVPSNSPRSVLYTPVASTTWTT